MNDHLYQWHGEQMASYEMREINHAVEQARLLREAGLSGEGWLARFVNGLRDLLKVRRKRPQVGRSIEPNVFPKKSSKSA